MFAVVTFWNMEVISAFVLALLISELVEILRYCPQQLIVMRA
jgi:hypothetical protein